MATALKLRADIKKYEAALKSKATPQSLKAKLENQLEKAKGDLADMRAKKPTEKKGKKGDLPKQFGAYKGSGVDIKKDSERPAKPVGKRKSKSGKTYYEYRLNRIDIKQPPKKYPKLEKGGMMEDGGLVVKSDQDLQEIAKYMAKAVKKRWDLKDLVYYFEQENNYDYKYRVKIWDEMNVWEMKKTEENIYKVLKAIVEANEKGGMMAEGGSIPEGYHQMPDGSIMADSAHMAKGGELHRMDEAKMEKGGEMKSFSEKEFKQILDESLEPLYMGLNKIDESMRYLELKGQGGLRSAFAKKIGLDDLKGSIEKIDEYVTKK